MAIYKTPGVYVEEIPKFPPSIAAVETAIPAFIGYTEKATSNGASLNLVPVAIESIAEYEAMFGGAASQDVTVYLNNDNNYVKAEAASALFLYDSLRMFYANGGGRCYIVSVGLYGSAVDIATIEKGLLAIESEDEPTILVMPDAVSIASDGVYDIQQKALIQSNKLMDRVTLCDLVRKTDYAGFDNEVKNFRNKVGINYLKYGAAYGPWINANLPRQIWRKNLSLKREGSNANIAIESLTADAQILSLIADTKLSEAAETAMKASVTSIAGSNKVLDDKLQSALDGYRLMTAASTETQLKNALQEFTNLTTAVMSAINSIKTTSYPVATQFKIIDSIASYLANPSLKDSIKSLAAHNIKIKVKSTNIILIATGANFDNSAKLLGYVDGAALLADVTLPNVSAAYDALDDADHKGRADLARDAAYVAAVNAINMFNSIQSSVVAFEKNLNESLYAVFGKFKELVSKGAEALNILPPSGAIAGVYAAVDRDRGVWKAPANVSLNAVIGPAVKVSHEQQAAYNIDVDAGKSINIIRTFPGKGTLVWGARTLAGNDNEWRYINVRRLFNFVEESIKKATEQFVFEPNDANTWVRLQAMVENFLTTLWRQGALQGVKPEHAFYVAVGLGKTMTPLDILEGRLIVEVGLAAVRPAEFIILKFSHKMVES
ncbi:MAG: phage tail sheath C-terminal domain-containing protein [Methylophilus sp.]|jgi:hypothetical protein